MYSQARQNLISAIRLVELAVKRRDKREPGRKEKEEAEARLARIFRKAFNKQKVVVSSWLENEYWDRLTKADPAIPDLDFDEEDYSDLISQFINMAKKGILLFGTGKPMIDYTLANAEAVKWAKEYAYSLVKGINETTRDTLRTVVRSFVDTPGFTLGDIMRELPFDEVRAQRIAITETTRAFAEGEMMAGRELRREFPGVRIIKIFYTNADDRVCPVCAPLDGMEVDFEDGFTTEEDKSEGIDAPPAHPGCRCWVETTTALAEL